MSEQAEQDCVVCRKHRRDADVPSALIFENDLLYISHAGLWGDEQSHYLGHVFVEPKRHVAGLGDLTAEEAQAVGLYTSRLAYALQQTLGVEHVYSFVLGHHIPHLHVHVIGRYPGTPREYWGLRVDEWPDAPRGTAVELAQLAAQLQNQLLTQDR